MYKIHIIRCGSVPIKGLRTVSCSACADMWTQVQNVLQTANSLNNALLTPGVSGLSDSLYQALVTALVGSDPLVYGAVIVFDPVHAGDSSSSASRRAPYVFRNSTTNKLQVRWPRSQPPVTRVDVGPIFLTDPTRPTSK